MDMGGSDVFVHINDCTGGQPKEGDVLSFDVVPRQNNPEHMQAKNVTGGTAPRSQSPGFTGPVEGTGAYSGTVKFMGAKGYGFITSADGTEIFINIKDCVGSKPVTGDAVKFDLSPSDNKPGEMQARNITGGSAPLDSALGMKGGFGAWGGKGMMSMGGGAWGKGMGMSYGGYGFGGCKGGMMMAGPYGKGGW